MPKKIKGLGYMFKKRPRPAISFAEISADKLLSSPSQPRKQFDSESLSGLCESIRQNGVVEPLTVRRLENGQYMIVSGERRLRAAKLAGFSKVPCVVMSSGEQNAAVFSLLHDFQHRPLDFFEQADAIYTLISVWGVPREDVAARLGLTQSELSAKLRLLRLTRWQRDRIRAANLSEGHARALLKIEDTQERDNILLAVIAKGMGVVETERMAEDTCDVELPAARKTEGARRSHPVVGDARLIMNTVNGAVESMRRAGINAASERRETERFVEFRILVPKAVGDETPAVVEL